MNKFIATANDAGRTILKFLITIYKDVPKSKIEKSFRNKDIKINGQRIKDKKIILKEGDIIEIYGIKYSEVEYKKAKIYFEKIFEDKNILIINKPTRVVVHGEDNCLDNQVLTYLDFKKIDSFIPSHIGRLDKGTSGIMVYAKNYQTLRQLLDNQDKITKIYRTISKLDKDTILNVKIFHNEMDQKEEISEKFGKSCQTEFKVLGKDLVEANLITGRKHQIRASLEYLKFPIKGDIKYGSSHAGRIYLHSYKIEFKNLIDDLEYLNGKTFVSDPKF